MTELMHMNLSAIVLGRAMVKRSGLLARYFRELGCYDPEVSECRVTIGPGRAAIRAKLRALAIRWGGGERKATFTNRDQSKKEVPVDWSFLGREFLDGLDGVQGVEPNQSKSVDFDDFFYGSYLARAVVLARSGTLPKLRERFGARFPLKIVIGGGHYPNAETGEGEIVAHCGTGQEGEGPFLLVDEVRVPKEELARYSG